jgi:AcrR family transcriptional regulator
MGQVLQKGMFCLQAKKGNSENRMVRECIFSALMLLMEKKGFNDISITELTNRAGVSRMAYYRNYNLKEDIILDYLDELFDEYRKQVFSNPRDDFQAACLYFAYFRKHEKLLVNLIDSGLSNLILIRYDKYLSTVFQNFYSHKKYEKEMAQYVIEYISGGLYKILISWARNGMKESDEYMAGIIVELMT